ncbi:hypothetical protein ACFSQ7_09950 [Paenibacillus rhizoplanae]
MNPVGQPLHQRPLTTKLILAGILGLVLFVMFQIAPQLLSGSGGDTALLSKKPNPGEGRRIRRWAARTRSRRPG